MVSNALKALRKMSKEGEDRRKNDPNNRAILKRRLMKLNTRKGPRVGDWIKEKNGNFTRITYIWRDERDIPFQYQTGGYKHSQYYFGEGYLQYSGGLDSGYEVPPTRFKKLSYTRLGSAWIFDHDIHQAGGAVYYQIPFRVYEVI